ncbi:MAG: cadherin-like domain-containing protein, partial [Synechococcaceae cyanobacterium]
AGAGNDTVDGGAGIDVAIYSGSIEQYTILQEGSDFLVYDNRSGSPDGLDRIRNLETLQFSGGVLFAPTTANTGTLQNGDNNPNALTGSVFGDQINGAGGDDTILGLGGNDQLNGDAGNDSIEGGEGGDVINAGSGADTVLAGIGNDSVLGGTENDSLLGEAGNDTLSGDAGNDTLSGGTHNDSLLGGDGHDAISGGSENDELQGNAGNDTLLGEAGNDTIYGNTGDDSAEGGDGADSFSDHEGNNISRGGAGNDTIYGAGLIDGGDDNDSLYYFSPYISTTYQAATVSGGAGHDWISEWGNYTHGTLLDGGSGNDSIHGSSYNDSLIGGEGDDSLNGNNGNDAINAGLGGDSINGGAGNDSIDGGDGVDVATYSGSITNYLLTHHPATGSYTLQDTRSGSADGTDLISGVEILSFSDDDLIIGTITGSLIEGSAGPDTLPGTAAADTLRGLAGNDSLLGLGAPDTIEGGEGNDSLFGGRGNDSLLGGAGLDSLQGDAGNDTLLGEAGNDTIYGNAGDDSAEGGDGADYLYDYEGNNISRGGAGNDTIQGAGLIDGGDDNDYLSYYSPYISNVYRASTVSGGAGHDWISEWYMPVHGSQLDGGAGNDTIHGSSYNDSLIGGDGDDSLHGNNGNDSINAGLGADVINGGAGNDSIDAGDGHDTITAGPGHDTLDGGDGANIAIYGGSRSQYSVIGDTAGLTIYDNRSSNPDGIDVVRNISILRFSDQDVSVESGLVGVLLEGTAGDDSSLIGTILNDTIRGLAGNDLLSGLAGNDLLEGGEGNDTLQGGSGNDTLQGGAGLNRAVFAGNRADYSITTSGAPASGNSTVVDLQPSLYGNDGTDLLSGVRLLQFLDQLYAINSAPLAVADTATTQEDTSLSISLASLLANDSDADGDLLSITGISATLNGIASISGGNLLLAPSANVHGTAVITYTLSDGFSTSPGSLSISVTPLNDAPSGSDKTIAILEDGSYTFSAADFGFTDPADASGPSGANGFKSVILSSLSGSGSLQLGGVAVSVGQEINTANISSLSYVAAANTNGSAIANLGFRVRDDGGTANGGSDLDPSANLIRFDAIAVNDAPAGSNGQVYLIDSNSYAFTISDFGFTDPSDSSASAGANLLNSIILTSLPALGKLLLGGAPVAIGQEISSANIGNLSYSAPVTPGSSPTAFSFLVRDNGGTANGGVNLDPSPNSITISWPGVVQFAASSFAVNENGTAISAITLNRSLGSQGAISVQISLSNGTAIHPEDYSANPIHVSFSDGELSKTVAIPVVNDTALEESETINLSLVNPTGGAVIGGQSTAVVTIVDNDYPPIPTPTVNPLLSNDTTPLLSGTATVTAVNSLRVSVNGRTYTLGSSPELQLSGTTWTLAVPAAHALPDGTYNVVATVQDPNGTAVSDGSVNELRVDTTAPPITLTSPASSADYFPTLSGQGEPGTTLQISLAGAIWSGVAVGATGLWQLHTSTAANSGSFAPNRDGSNPLAISGSDAAGNTGVLNSSLLIRYPYPDLQIHSASLSGAAALSTVSLSYSATNNAPSGPLLAGHTATGTWVDRFYLSPDAVYGNGNDLSIGPALVGGTGKGLAISGPLAPGSTYSQSLEVQLPEYPGQYYLIAVTDANLNLNEGAEENNHVFISATPISVAPIYSASVGTSTEISNAGQTIFLSGSLLRSADGLGVAGKPVTVVFTNQTTGVQTSRSVSSGTNGLFSLSFTPGPDQAGTYSVAARYAANPREDTLPGGGSAAEDSFRVQGLTFLPAAPRHHPVAAGATVTGSLNLRNTGPDPLTSSGLSVSGAPAGWLFHVRGLPASLAAGASVTPDSSHTAPDASVLFADFELIATATAPGLPALTARQPFAVTILPNLPVLSVAQAQRSAAMLLGRRTLHEVTLTTRGNA